MLVLSRKVGESLVIGIPGGEVIITVVELQRGKVRIGITAPKEVHILRECMTPGCKGTSAMGCNGLCMTCQGNAQKLVETGKTSWEELTALGLIKSKVSSFEAEFLKRKEAL